MSETCQLEVEPFKQCCCNCKHHWQDFHHCITAPKDVKPGAGGCQCSVPKGWACVVKKLVDPGGGRIHSGWPEHSIGCEMYTPVKKI